MPMDNDTVINGGHDMSNTIYTDRMINASGPLAARIVNADGSTSLVAEVAAEMLAAGTPRRCVDAWLMGLDQRHQRRASK